MRHQTPTFFPHTMQCLATNTIPATQWEVETSEKGIRFHTILVMVMNTVEWVKANDFS